MLLFSLSDSWSLIVWFKCQNSWIKCDFSVLIRVCSVFLWLSDFARPFSLSYLVQMNLSSTWKLKFILLAFQKVSELSDRTSIEGDIVILSYVCQSVRKSGTSDLSVVRIDFLLICKLKIRAILLRYRSFRDLFRLCKYVFFQLTVRKIWCSQQRRSDKMSESVVWISDLVGQFVIFL